MKTIQGFIVIEDYSDPLKSEYRMFDSKEDAIDVAKQRLRNILDEENIEKQADELADNGMSGRYDELAETLEMCHHVCIQNIIGGYMGNVACIKIAEIYK
jgi:hypothetical protein